MTSADAVPVHPSNVEAMRAWDGGDGDYWADHDTTFDKSLSAYQRSLFDAAAVRQSDHVVDIGCGNGQTTRDAARRAESGSALGVDLSSRMLDVARRRAREERIENVRFVQADAQVHRFDEGAFDLAISRAGAMFFGDPVAAFANIGRALRPDGRLVLLVWQELAKNHWIRDFSTVLAAGREQPAPPPDAPGPFSLADPDRARAVLAAAGFADIALDGVEAPLWFGETTAEAYRFVRGLGFTEFLLRDLDARARNVALDDLRANIEAHHTDGGVFYPSAAWIISARRA